MHRRSAEARSFADMAAVLIREYGKRNGIPIPEQDELFDNTQAPAKTRK